MCAQILAATHQADRELRVDGALGDAQAIGNRAMGKSLDASQREDFAAPRRQRAHGVVEQREFLFMTEGFGGIGPFLYNG